MTELSHGRYSSQVLIVIVFRLHNCSAAAVKLIVFGQAIPADDIWKIRDMIGSGRLSPPPIRAQLDSLTAIVMAIWNRSGLCDEVL